MPFDAHKNFAYSTVLTAPSPASSGTSLVVQSGDGTKFPAVSFNAVVWPAGVQPSTTNAEIVRVTAISTDTFTITRTQESTSARSIIVGDQIAAAVTKKWWDDIEAATTKTVRVPVNLMTPQFTSNAGNSFFTNVALTAWDAGHWEFLKDVVGKVFGVVMVPPTYVSGGTLKLLIGANATSGVTTLSVATKAVADAESMNPSSFTDETDQDITVPGTAYLQKVVSFSLTESLAANDLLLVEINHVGTAANDTLAVNTILWGAWLEVNA